MSSSERFSQAQSLIAQGRYDEARALLRTINHPMALDMLDQIDRIQNSNIARAVPVRPEMPVKPRHRLRNLLLLLIGGCCLITFLPFLSSRPKVAPTQAAVVPSNTPTRTFTPGPSPTASNTPTSTMTPTATATPNAQELQQTRVANITATIQARYNATVDADRAIRAAIRAAIPDSDLNIVEASADLISVEFPLNELSAGVALFDARTKIPKYACALRRAGFTTQRYLIVGMIPLVDKFGSNSIGRGVSAILSTSTIARLNCSNESSINIEAAADTYAINPALTR